MIAEFADAAVAKQTSKREEANLTLVQEKARFVGDHTVESTNTGETPTAEKVVIAAGSQLVVPDAINGLNDVEFLTSDDAIWLEESPDRPVVLGGRCIAAELGYYFESFGTDVTLIEMEDSLIPREDSHIAHAFTEITEDRH